MTETEKKRFDLAEKISDSMLDVLGEEAENLSKTDCVVAVLFGSTTLISSIHKTMNEDVYEEMTADVLAQWARRYRECMVDRPNENED